jgi:hypothetical protein
MKLIWRLFPIWATIFAGLYLAFEGSAQASWACMEVAFFVALLRLRSISWRVKVQGC